MKIIGNNLRCGKTLLMQKIYEQKKAKGEKIITSQEVPEKPLGAFKLYPEEDTEE